MDVKSANKTGIPLTMAQRNKLKFNHGITGEQYYKMFEQQKGCCAICGKHQIKFKKRLVVDHNHNTKQIRGLLCHNCNVSLGLVGESIETLRNMVEYLK